MRISRFTLIAIAAGLAVGFAAAPQQVAAQGAPAYTLSTHSIDGGAGVAMGGVYSLTSIIGQPDAGPTLTGGTYSLTGGFFFPMADNAHVRGWSLY